MLNHLARLSFFAITAVLAVVVVGSSAQADRQAGGQAGGQAGMGLGRVKKAYTETLFKRKKTRHGGLHGDLHGERVGGSKMPVGVAAAAAAGTERIDQWSGC